MVSSEFHCLTYLFSLGFCFMVGNLFSRVPQLPLYFKCLVGHKSNFAVSQNIADRKQGAWKCAHVIPWCLPTDIKWDFLLFESDACRRQASGLQERWHKTMGALLELGYWLTVWRWCIGLKHVYKLWGLIFCKVQTGNIRTPNSETNLYIWGMEGHGFLLL